MGCMPHNGSGHYGEKINAGRWTSTTVEQQLG